MKRPFQRCSEEIDWAPNRWTHRFIGWSLQMNLPCNRQPGDPTIALNRLSTAEASIEATPHPDGTCNCDLDVGFLSALLYINPCYRRKGNREPGSADESGNRWLQGFHAFQALGRFATSVHRLEPPDEPFQITRRLERSLVTLFNG